MVRTGQPALDRSGAASAVLAEVSFQDFYDGQCRFHDAVHFMAEYGFTLFALGGYRARPAPGSDRRVVRRRPPLAKLLASRPAESSAGHPSTRIFTAVRHANDLYQLYGG